MLFRFYFLLKFRCGAVINNRQARDTVGISIIKRNLDFDTDL